jgi:hypothetical protein
MKKKRFILQAKFHKTFKGKRDLYGNITKYCFRPKTKTGILIDGKGRLSSQLQYAVTFDPETLLNPLLTQRIYNNKM